MQGPRSAESIFYLSDLPDLGRCSDQKRHLFCVWQYPQQISSNGQQQQGSRQENHTGARKPVTENRRSADGHRMQPKALPVDFQVNAKIYIFFNLFTVHKFWSCWKRCYVWWKYASYVASLPATGVSTLKIVKACKLAQKLYFICMLIKST